MREMIVAMFAAAIADEPRAAQITALRDRRRMQLMLLQHRYRQHRYRYHRTTTAPTGASTEHPQ